MGAGRYESAEAEPDRSGPVHCFMLAILRPINEQSDPVLEADDLRVRHGPDGQSTVVFEREAPSFKEALFSALREVRAAGLVVRRVEPDDLVTQAEIAERLGRSSESVRLLSSGRRGNRSFPQPVVRTTIRGSLWRWSEVAVWARRPPDEIERAELIALVNTELHRTMYTTLEKEAALKEVKDVIGGCQPRLPPAFPRIPRSLIAAWDTPIVVV